MSNRVWQEGRLGKAGSKPQIIFAQVREESAIELELLAARPAGETVFCIASGGCTALSLLLAKPAQLQMVDVNPAQFSLVELKIAALKHLTEGKCKMALLRDARAAYTQLRPMLSPQAQCFWDDNSQLLALGLNQCGVIDLRLKQLMRLLPLVQSRRNVRRLFRAKSLKEQRKVYQTFWNHWRWALVFQVVLSKPVLKLAYGDEFVAAIPPGFAAEMKHRLDETFLRHPLHENGYLWQLFRGCYPPNEASLPPYLQHWNLPTVRTALSQTQLACADATQWLENQPPSSIGFFAFSNILEISSLDYATRLLRAVAHAAKPGATVCLRSIFPFNEALLKQAAKAANLHYRQLESASLAKKDRSFFCTNLRVLEICKLGF